MVGLARVGPRFRLEVRGSAPGLRGAGPVRGRLGVAASGRRQTAQPRPYHLLDYARSVRAGRGWGHDTPLHNPLWQGAPRAILLSSSRPGIATTRHFYSLGAGLTSSRDGRAYARMTDSLSAVNELNPRVACTVAPCFHSWKGSGIQHVTSYLPVFASSSP